MRSLSYFLAAVSCLYIYLLIASWLTEALSLPLPATITAMLLLLLSLILLGDIPEFLSEPVERCLPHLSLLFVPAMIGVTQLGGIGPLTWGLFTVFLLISWAVGFVAVALILKRFLAKKARADEH